MPKRACLISWILFFSCSLIKAMLRLQCQNCTVLSHGCCVFVHRGDGAVVFVHASSSFSHGQVEMNANLWFSWRREGHCFYVGARLELFPNPTRPPVQPPTPRHQKTTARGHSWARTHWSTSNVRIHLSYHCSVLFLFSCFYLYDTL